MIDYRLSKCKINEDVDLTGVNEVARWSREAKDPRERPTPVSSETCGGRGGVGKGDAIF